MKFKSIEFQIGNETLSFTGEIELDLGELDREPMREALKELIETCPDADIAEIIDACGTDDLCKLITPWVLENNENVQEVPSDSEKIQS